MKVPDLKAVNRAWEACSWRNTKETPETWLAVLVGSDLARRKRLFGRIFAESPDEALIRELFDEDSIRAFLRDYDRPLKRSYAERRRKVWRYLYCGIREPIPELDWVIGSLDRPWMLHTTATISTSLPVISTRFPRHSGSFTRNYAKGGRGR